MAIDLGRARVGIAKSDSLGMLATPVATAHRGKNDIAIIMRLVREYHPLEIYVGYPLNMDGSMGAAAVAATRWAGRLARKVAPVPVRMIDERLTSVIAHRQLHEAGRREIHHRAVVDQVAAVNILESALETERTSGAQPGITVSAAANRIAGNAANEKNTQ
ncbi:MAG: Holliday junction resolvase RuvX [Arcanobacterium sp.]|nr:Holliday junction resolvase RuvX [Arcanobacterium sp.]MDY5589760.1 Holliday junction resolvase RuvX [Arcanobacterium sp.]